MSTRFRHPRHAVGVLICAALTSLAVPASASPASPSPPPTDPPPEDPSSPAFDPAAADVEWAPYPGGDIVSPNVVGSVITAGSCKYRQANDDPHAPRSSYASIHGWWQKAGGTCPSKANVDVYLQAYGCNPYPNCDWFTLDSGSGDYVPGPGSGKWANARHNCSSSRTVGWRGYTDVDLPGISDPSWDTVSNVENLPCVP